LYAVEYTAERTSSSAAPAIGKPVPEATQEPIIKTASVFILSDDLTPFFSRSLQILRISTRHCPGGGRPAFRAGCSASCPFCFRRTLRLPCGKHPVRTHLLASGTTSMTLGSPIFTLPSGTRWRIKNRLSSPK